MLTLLQTATVFFTLVLHNPEKVVPFTFNAPTQDEALAACNVFRSELQEHIQAPTHDVSVCR